MGDRKKKLRADSEKNSPSLDEFKDANSGDTPKLQDLLNLAAASGSHPPANGQQKLINAADPLALQNLPPNEAAQQQQQQEQRFVQMQQQMDHQRNLMQSFARTMRGLETQLENLVNIIPIQRPPANHQQPPPPAAALQQINQQPPPQAAALQLNRQQPLGQQPANNGIVPPAAMPPQQQQQRPLGLMSQETVAKTILNSIEQYNGDDYERWAERVRRVVDMQQLAEHIDQNITAIRPNCQQTAANDRTLYAMIEGLISSDYLNRLELESATCFGLWQRLQEVNQYQIKLKKERAWTKFIDTTRAGPTSNINEYLDEAIRLYAGLKRRKASLDELCLYSVLAGLPDSKFYRSRIMDQDISFTEQIERVRQMLPQAEGQRVSTSGVLTTQSASGERRKKKSRSLGANSLQFNRDSPRESGERKERYRCYRCGQTGHIATGCRSADPKKVLATDEQEEASSESESVDTAAEHSGDEFSAFVYNRHPSDESDQDVHPEMSSVNQEQQTPADRIDSSPHRDQWLLDTGSSVSVCNDLKWFESHSPVMGQFEYPDQSDTLRAEAMGSVKLKLEGGRTLDVRDVHYCPTATTNLLANIGLDESLSLSASSSEVVACYWVDGERRSFRFAAVRDGESQICIDPAAIPNGEPTRTNPQPLDNNQHHPQDHAGTSESSIDERAAESAEQPSTSAEPSIPPKKPGGRPRKQSPPRKLDPMPSESAAPDDVTRGVESQRQKIEKGRTEDTECETASKLSEGSKPPRSVSKSTREHLTVNISTTELRSNSQAEPAGTSEISGVQLESGEVVRRLDFDMRPSTYDTERRGEIGSHLPSGQVTMAFDLESDQGNEVPRARSGQEMMSGARMPRRALCDAAYHDRWRRSWYSNIERAHLDAILNGRVCIEMAESFELAGADLHVHGCALHLDTARMRYEIIFVHGGGVKLAVGPYIDRPRHIGLGEKHGARKDWKIRSSPTANKASAVSDGGPSAECEEYAELMGKLLYIAVATRPDIPVVIIQPSRFRPSPRRSHRRWSMDILRCPVAAIDLAFVIEPPDRADMGAGASGGPANLRDRCLPFGAPELIGGSSTSCYRSRRVASMVDETEIAVACGGARERPICGQSPQLVTCMNDTGAVSIAEREPSRRTRCADVCVLARGHQCERGESERWSVESEMNIADGLMDGLTGAPLVTLREFLCLSLIV